MADLTFFDATGEIAVVYSGQRPDDIIALLPEFNSKEGNFDDKRFCSINNEVVEKLQQATTVTKTEVIADGVDEITILNAPIGASVSIKNLDSGELLEGVIDGTDSFATNVAGTYKVTIKKPTYLPYEVIINAV